MSVSYGQGISLVMANHNKGEYIAEAINSVLKQNDNRWQLIILDDASSDNSTEIIKRFLPHPQIIYHNFLEKKGYVTALNTMIGLADYEIIGIIDSDDALAVNAVGEILKIYEKYSDASFVYSQFLFCDIDLKPQRPGFCQVVPAGLSNIHNYYSGPWRTFRKKLFNEVGGFDINKEKAEDRDIIFKMEERAKFYFVNRELYYYRVLPDSESHGSTNYYLSKSSYVLAKLHAYQRRLNTNFPNLTATVMSKEMWNGVIYSLAIFKWRRAGFFFSRALAIHPLSILNLPWFLKRILQEWKHRLYLKSL